MPPSQSDAGNAVEHNIASESASFASSRIERSQNGDLILTTDKQEASVSGPLPRELVLPQQSQVIWEEEASESKVSNAQWEEPYVTQTNNSIQKPRYPQMTGTHLKMKPEEYESLSNRSKGEYDRSQPLVQSGVEVERAMTHLLEQQVRIVRQVIVVQLRRMLQALERIKQASRE